MKNIVFNIFRLALILNSVGVFAQIDKGTVVVRPHRIEDVLVNLGIGFTIFQRFNGDVIYNNKIFIPKELPSGSYQLQLALVEASSSLDTSPKAKIKLANEGVTKDGWYDLGNVKIKKRKGL